MSEQHSTVEQNTKELKKNTRVGYFKVVVQGLFIGLVAWQIYLFGFADNSGKDKSHIAVIEVKGAITSDSRYGDGIAFGTTIDQVASNPNVKAVLIEANSPGGSPTQAEIMVSALKNLSTQKPVVISIGDLCASACLFALASNPDIPIYAHRSSMIGSVGVKIESWGVNMLLDKLEVERRSYSVGEHKVFLDPFSAEDSDVVNHIETELLTPVFDQFKEMLITGRKDKLSDDPKVFSGLLWVGSHAAELGLVDDVKTNYEIRKSLSEEYGTSSFVSYNSKKRTFTEMLSISIGDSIVDSLTSKVLGSNVGFN